MAVIIKQVMFGFLRKRAADFFFFNEHFIFLIKTNTKLNCRKFIFFFKSKLCIKLKKGQKP